MIGANLQQVQIKVVVLFLVALSIAACGTITSSTVKLSAELTARTKDLEQVHLTAVNFYFDSERGRVIRFMNEEWIPLYLRNFLGMSNILADLQKTDSIGQSTRDQLKDAAESYLDDPSEAERLADALVTALDNVRTDEHGVIVPIIKNFVPDDKVDAATVHMEALLNTETPAVLIIEFAAAANEEIAAQRQALLAPLERARRNALSEVKAAYADLYAGQGVITGRLEAAAKRSAQEANLLDALGGEGTAAKVKDKLGKYSVGINKAFDKVKKVEELLEEETKDGGKAEPMEIVDILLRGIEKTGRESGLLEGKKEEVNDG